MIDSKWWSSYFALPDPPESGGVATGSSSTQPHFVDIEAELEREEYWMRRYLEITGDDGRWVYTGGIFNALRVGARGVVTRARGYATETQAFTTRATSSSLQAVWDIRSLFPVLYLRSLLPVLARIAPTVLISLLVFYMLSGLIL